MSMMGDPEMMAIGKAEEPCEAYFGNECSGFGGSLTCYRCGWQRDEHPSEKVDLDWVKEQMARGDTS